MTKKIAVFAGTFSPFTLGHLSLVRRALPLFDEIIVALGVNTEKSVHFPIEQRLKWIEKIFKDEEKVTTETYQGLTVDFCAKKKAQFIIRGLRDSQDFKYEKGIAQMNQSMNNKIETIFLITDPKYSHISSTIVRDIIHNGGDISKFVPKEVII
jgi:pantetheine-phosphate adenylyltransferase